MPFKSERQRRFLWAKKPAVARKFAKDEKEPWHKKSAKNTPTKPWHKR